MGDTFPNSIVIPNTETLHSTIEEALAEALHSTIEELRTLWEPKPGTAVRLDGVQRCQARALVSRD